MLAVSADRLGTLAISLYHFRAIYIMCIALTLAVYLNAFYHPCCEPLDFAEDASFVERYESFFVVFVLSALVGRSVDILGGKCCVTDLGTGIGCT